MKGCKIVGSKTELTTSRMSDGTERTFNTVRHEYECPGVFEEYFVLWVAAALILAWAAWRYGRRSK